MTDPLMAYLVIPLVKIVVLVAVLMLVVAYLTFAERKVLAYMQVRIGPNRVGPRGWLQPIADGLKLFVKEDLIPSGAQRFVFVLAPCLIFVPAFLVWAVIPFSPATDLFGLLPEPIEPFLADINIAVLFVLGVSSVGVFGLILGGWASNNKFSLMGGLRSAAQMVSYEVPLGFAIVAVLLMAGSLSMVDIVEAQRDMGVWFVFPGILAFGLYFVCGVAETNRNPFDLPEAESELVAPFPNLLAGMWALPVFAWIPPFVWYAVKVAFFIVLYIWFRGTFPRYRFDQLMEVGWKWLLPLSLANIVLVGLGVMLLKG